MRLVRAFGLAAGLAMVGSMAFAGGASAKPIAHNTDFHDEASETIPNYCDAGLTVQLDTVLDGQFLFNPHGPDGVPYFHLNAHFTAVFTNLDNGNTVTRAGKFVNKDLRVTDNGDGTLTVLNLDTGFFNVYGPDGKTPDSKAIARDSGQVRLKALFDQNGTPNDPFDDEVISAELVKVTGRTDDICAAEVPLLVG
jgi:hypothetical protein